MNPMVDGWMGDDWFHNGAFRQQNMPYIYEQAGTRDNDAPTGGLAHFDDYDELHERRAQPGEPAAATVWNRLASGASSSRTPPTTRSGATRPWTSCSPPTSAEEGIKVPIMLVHSLWDQEDIYGAPAVYKAIKPLDKDNDKVFLVMGPWHHGQEIEDAGFARRHPLRLRHGYLVPAERPRPFLAHYLKDDAPPMSHVAPVTAFETGANSGRSSTPGPFSGMTAASSQGGLQAGSR